MADFEPPSFSLGLDLDSQSETQISGRSSLHPSHQDSFVNAGVHAGSLDEIEQDEAMDSDRSERTRVLKRLRRGAGPRLTNLLSSSLVKTRELQGSCSGSADDEIEGFSSQEDLLIRDEHPPAQHSSICSSSKVPLHGPAVLTVQSSSQCKTRKYEQASDAPSSASLETSHNGLMFPKLTISPLRRFQLLDPDSDSDHPFGCEIKADNRIDPPSKRLESSASEGKRKVPVFGPQNEDLCKDFCPIKSFPISTPVLDEVCNEYFQSIKDKNAASIDACVGNSKRCHTTTSSSQNFEQSWDVTDPLPPTHHYFFHDDPRIQKSQLSNGEAPKQKGTRTTNSNKNLTRERNKTNKSNAEEGLHITEGWLDPKSNSAIPQDAGKRPVHAHGQSAGHWCTSPEGRKVYVSRSQQELSGQIAYRQYRKESGAGFRKSKNKTSGKKKKTKS